MAPKDFSIKIGDIELSTKNLPKGDIDLSQIDSNQRAILSIFDTNKNGHLSAKEVENAISIFASHDKEYMENKEYKSYEGDKITKKVKHNKDGEIDGNEMEDLTENLYKISGEQKREFINAGYNHRRKQVGEGLYLEWGRELDTLTAAEVLVKNINRVKIAEDMQLQNTYHEYWKKDSDGNHYRWNEKTEKYEKMDDVTFVNKDGSYIKKTKIGDKKYVEKRNYDAHNIPIKLKLYNPSGKGVYVNKDFVAKNLGLKKILKQETNNLILKDKFSETDSYIDVNSHVVYKWDAKKHEFYKVDIVGDVLVDEKFDDGTVHNDQGLLRY